MTPLFNIVDGALVEQSRMSVPNMHPSDFPDPFSYGHSFWGNAWGNYNEHLKSLRSYPILSEEDWVKKEGITEDEFYLAPTGNLLDDRDYAWPMEAICVKPAERTQEDIENMWLEVAQTVVRLYDEHKSPWQVVRELQTKFNITLK